jgi:hypothetical protein
MDYRPSKPHGQAIASDRHLTLLADDDGVGFVHCDDGVLVVPDREVQTVDAAASAGKEPRLVNGPASAPTSQQERNDVLAWLAEA